MCRTHKMFVFEYVCLFVHRCTNNVEMYSYCFIHKEKYLKQKFKIWTQSLYFTQLYNFWGNSLATMKSLKKRVATVAKTGQICGKHRKGRTLFDPLNPKSWPDVFPLCGECGELLAKNSNLAVHICIIHTRDYYCRRFKMFICKLCNFWPVFVHPPGRRITAGVTRDWREF